MQSINEVAIVGAGYMGGGIAQIFAKAGYSVRISDASLSAATAARERLIVEAQEFEKDELFERGSADLVAKNIRAVEFDEAVATADFIEEAVYEDVELKRQILGRISRAARSDAIIGTNTSTLPVRELVSAVEHPERFLTVHFSNPAPFIPGVELVAAEPTKPEIVETVRGLLSRVGCEGALVADSPGMVLNRLQYALLREAFLIAEDGVASHRDIDTIVRTTFGFRLGFFGPFAIADQAGLDVYGSGYKTLRGAFGERFEAPDSLKAAIEAGKHGLKNGHGLLQDFQADDIARLVAYRNRAYARMGQLIAELGPAPLDPGSQEAAE